MRSTAIAAAFGLMMWYRGVAWADGDAEVPPSPGQLRKLPSRAEVPERPAEPAAARPASTEPARAGTVKVAGTATASGAPVKPLLPADYRPHGDGSAAKEAPAVKSPAKATTAVTKKGIPLAPTEGQLRREIELRNGGSATPAADDRPVGQRLSDKATSVPNQRRNWPTTVTNTAGPTSPAGPGSAQDRKGTVIEATGPQQGVIRNRW